jgi:hypothetical protein
MVVLPCIPPLNNNGKYRNCVNALGKAIIVIAVPPIKAAFLLPSYAYVNAPDKPSSSYELNVPCAIRIPGVDGKVLISNTHY